MTDKESYISVLQGCLNNLPTLNSRLVRIFISSTFTDTKEERNLLLEDVYPRLKSHCKEVYGMDFQLVDMRWGVPIDAADDHLASKICMEEIQNCQKLSTGPNFVTFLNQKHGYRPLQLTIPDAEFTNLVTCLQQNDNDTTLMEKWYLKDENQIPAVYVLQTISSLIPTYKDKQNEDAKAEWNSVFNALRKDFKFASKKCHEAGQLSEEDKHKYFMSVTEEEISRGILQLQKNPTDHCLCFVRIIEDITTHLEHNKAWRFIDIVKQDENIVDEEAQTFLARLRDEKVVQKLNNFNITKNVVKWSENEGINRQDHEAYLTNFKETFYNGVISLIEKAVKTEVTLAKDELYIEVLQHLVMASQRCATFQGREEILQQIKTYLMGEQTSLFILYGQSGCGKTSIMAKTAQMVPTVLKSSVVVLRFLGTSPNSSNLWRLLHSLCAQIQICYNKDKNEVPEELSDLKQFFLESLKLATADKPLVVLLDSLDQLSREHKSYNLNWLPRKVPPHVKFIVSSYTEAQDLIGTLRLAYLSDCFILVPIFSTELSAKVLSSWLNNEHRCLNNDQFEIVKRAFQECSLPLFVKLTFDKVVRWHSYTPIEDCDLNHTVQSSIEYLFQQLEKKHGQVLVSRALAYVTASKVGISETELEDLLSLDDVVLTSVFQIHIPPVRRIPPLLLVRIRYDISQYLVDKEVDDVRSFFWYHRQFYEVCKKRYLSDKNMQTRIHSDMADYYIGKWYGVKKPFNYTPEQMKKHGVKSPESEADRKIAAQPLIFNADAASSETPRYNKRKLSRLPYHLYSAKRPEELRSLCLFNYEWLKVKLQATSLQELLLDFTLFGEKESILVKVLKSCQSTLVKFPETLCLEISGRLLSLLQSRAENHEQSLLEQTLKASGQYCKLVPYQPCYTIPSEAQIYQIEHHNLQSNTTMFDMSNDASRLAILSGNNEVLIYDVKTGELDNTVPLSNEGDNYNVMVKPKKYDVIIAAGTNQMKSNIVVLMDITTGIIENKLNLNKLYPKIGFNDDYSFELTDNYLISHVLRQAVDVFDRHTGKLVYEFEGQPDQMTLLADDKYILLHPKQTNIYSIYSIADFKLVQQFICDGTPDRLYLGNQSDVGCIVMKGAQRVQLVHMADGDKLGTFLGDINLETKATIQSAEVYGNICLIATFEELYLWDLKVSKLKHTLKIPDKLVPDYRVTSITAFLTLDLSNVIAAYTNHFILWNASTGKFIHSIEASRGLISRAVLSTNGDIIVNTTRRSNTLTAWDVNKIKLKSRHFEPLSMSDSARYLSIDRSGSVVVVRSSKSSEFAVIDVTQGIKTMMISKDYEAMNPYITDDGKYAVLREYNSDSCLKTWDLTTGNLVASFPISSLSLKGYVLGTRQENMAIMIEDEVNGDHSMKLCQVPSNKTLLEIPLPKYNIMEIIFVQNDEYFLIGVEEQLHPGIKIYAQAFSVKTGEVVQQFDKFHPKNIQMITPENTSFIGQRIYTDKAGVESWELATAVIATGEIVMTCQDPPQSRLCFGSIGRYGISQERSVYDIEKGVKCKQFDKDGEYPDKLPSSRTAPKVTADEKYALWLHLRQNLLMVGEIATGLTISICPVHSIPMNIEVTPERIILIGCEDGRIMMLQMLIDEGTDLVATIKGIFNRSKRLIVQTGRSLLKPSQDRQKENKKLSLENSGSSKACYIL